MPFQYRQHNATNGEAHTTPVQARESQHMACNPVTKHSPNCEISQSNLYVKEISQ